jgi:hypothetical protein
VLEYLIGIVSGMGLARRPIHVRRLVLGKNDSPPATFPL